MATGLLRRVAAAHVLDVGTAATRTELIEAVTSRLGDAAYLRGVWEALGEPERAALADAIHAGGEIRGFLLQRRLGSTDATPAAALLDKALLVRTFSPFGPHRGEVFAVPEEVAAALRQWAPAPAVEPGHGRLQPVPAPPRDAWRGTDPTFSLFALASYLQRHRGEEDRGKLMAGLGGEVREWAHEPAGWGWQERWTFLRHVGTAAGLLRQQPDGPALPSGSLREALRQPLRLAERLWKAYLRARDWSELERSGLPHADELGQQVDLPAMRAEVLGLLGKLEQGAWYRLDALLAWLEAVEPGFLREQLDSRAAALVDPDTARPLLAEGSWQRVEGRVLRTLLLGPLYWLGVVGTDVDGAHVTLSRRGAALLAGAVDGAARAPEPAVWHARVQMEATARADLGTLLAAERYLRLEQRGQPSRYRLDRDRFASALSSGGSADECRELLTRLTGDTLPPDVERLLSDWEHRFGALVLRPAVLLEAHDAADLDEALAAEGIARLVKTRLSPTLAEVPASHAAELADALHAVGHLPRLDASLRLLAGRRAYQSLVDERTLEFLLVSLLAFERARPEQLLQLEGAPALTARLRELFPPQRLAELEAAAAHLAATFPLPTASRRRKKAPS